MKCIFLAVLNIGDIPPPGAPIPDTAMGYLNGDPGKCNWVKTMSGFKRCGLATQLMAICFQDDDVRGGRDEETTDTFALDYNKDQQKWVNDNCAAIIYLQCYPAGKPIPWGACTAYLDGATIAGYNKLFTSKGRTPVRRWSLRVAKNEFGEDPEAFIHKYGWEWFFCKQK